MPPLDGSSKSVFEEFSENVFEVSGHMSEFGVGLAIDDQRGTDTVFQLADLGDKRFAIADDFGGLEGGIDNSDVAGIAMREGGMG